MLNKGVWVLSIWCLLNILPGLGSLLSIFLGYHAPGLRMLFEVQEISLIEARALATVDALATLLNTLIAVYCASVFVVVRKCLSKGERWSFFVLAGGVVPLQTAGYVSDLVFLGGRNLLALNISSAFLLLGYGLCATELFRKNAKEFIEF